MTYNALPALLNPGNDVSLGTFSNAGLNALQAFPLPLSHPNFVNDMAPGNEISLYLTAVTAHIGFTFHSRNSSSAGSRPFLTLTAVAVPEPASVGLLGLGLVGLGFAQGRLRD